MDEITKTNTSRILKFLQPFKLNFNNYTVWTYTRKKFHYSPSNHPQILDAIAYLEADGYFEKLKKPGYYRLTEKGRNFDSWETEEMEKSLVEYPKQVQNSWRSWLTPTKDLQETA